MVDTCMHCISGRDVDIGIDCMMTILITLACTILTKSLLKMYPLKENTVQYLCTPYMEVNVIYIDTSSTDLALNEVWSEGKCKHCLAIPLQ